MTGAVPELWTRTLHGDGDPRATVRGHAPTAAPACLPRTASIALPTDPRNTQDMGATLDDGAATLPGGAPRELDFEVLRLLGEGGMGIVYAARQESLAREVALKVPRGQGPQRAASEGRLAQEALVTGGLDHPNIVPVHDLGRDPQGRLFMAMKLVRGRPWSACLADPAAAALREQLEVLLKVADAVAFAHSRGVVHRDLKPENVMVGDFGEVLVMDWGLALDLREAALREPGPRPSLSAGTPSYISPEQVRGDPAQIGPWSDVYLLGAILYELLTGTPPHLGRTVLEVLAAALSGEIEPPEQRAPGRPQPRELVRIALRALHREPEQRFPDVPSLQAALRTYLAHQDSLRLSEDGTSRLELLDRAGAVPLAERYASHADALAAFAQALHLWPENEDALLGQARAAEGYANEALDRGDVGLASAQIAVLARNPRADPGRRQALQAALLVREVSRGRARRAALLVAVLLGLGYLGLGVLREQAQQRRGREATSAALRGELDGAWAAVRAGDLPGLTRARVRLAAADLQDRRAEAGWLAWAHQVLLWRRGRIEEAREAARLGGPPPPVAAELAGRPFRLEQPPFGEPATGAGSPSGGPSIPVADGSRVEAEGASLVRRSADGAVLGRFWLDGEIALLWPDPADATRLVALIAGSWHAVGVRAGRADAPVFDPTTGLPPLAAAAEARHAELGKEARALSGDPAALRQRIVAELRSAAERDPDNPFLWLRALQAVGPSAPAEQRRELADRVAAVSDLPVTLLVEAAMALDEAGFRLHADALLERARRRFLDRHGNPDLAAAAPGAALALRGRGSKLFESGDTVRALELLEASRSFSTFLDGDDRLRQRQARWLEQQGRTAEARALAARIHEGQPPAGAIRGVAVQAVVQVLLLAPWVLLVLALRCWWRSQPTRLADLRSRGWRSPRERALALFTHPFERAGFLFLAYAPRRERLLFAGLGALILACASLLAAAVAGLGENAALSPELQRGYPGREAASQALDRELREGERPGLLRLSAERHRARGESALAGADLARLPGDALALNNAAVLAEERGDLERARAGYAQAAAGHGGGAAAAAWNLARLRGDPAQQAALAHRDLPYAAAGRPLWALCPAGDLEDALPRHSLIGAAFASLAYLITEPGQIFDLLVVARQNRTHSLAFLLATVFVYVFGYLFGFLLVALACLALVWLPLPVRPLDRHAGALAGHPRIDRGLAWLGALLPGSWELLAGRAGLGAATLLALSAAWGLCEAVVYGSALDLRLVPGGSAAYFANVPAGLAHPELAWLAWAAGAFLAVVFIVNLRSAWPRLRAAASSRGRAA